MKDSVDPILTDVDGNRLLPKDRVMLLRGTHKGEIAEIKRIGLKDWKGSSGRTPRTCAIVKPDARWGPFGILGDGVRLLERHEDNMVKAHESQAWLHVYRFNLKFHFKGERNGNVQEYDTREVGATVAAVTSRGFEMWRAIVPGKSLIKEIGEAAFVTVELRDKSDKVGRQVELGISDPCYLPFGVGIELGGQRIGRLDATDSEIALEGVVFRRCQVIEVEDSA